MARTAKKAAVRAEGKTRATGVRDRVLLALGKGAATREDMRKKIGCSMASLDGHLKELRSTGVVVATAGRPKRFQLSGGAKGIANAKSSRGELGRSLDSVMESFRAGESLKRKIRVLEDLIQGLPPGLVVEVLREIRADYGMFLRSAAPVVRKRRRRKAAK